MAVDPLLLFCLVARHNRKNPTQKDQFYRNNQQFRFQTVLSISENGIRTTYLASKIYIINDEIANLESLNFTGGVITSNNETSIHVNDAPSVQN
ncbi:hypothetical protein SAMN05421636_1232 [Pricia antarctica]|uniref:Uncharacterized protein n=2 Tax=Pricia antarctica TaxID=641691 RepID=A0A1G7JE89_9FLAO|nr:hypothetical protein SAMN05421636_1232 [Pricia antarctica]